MCVIPPHPKAKSFWNDKRHKPIMHFAKKTVPPLRESILNTELLIILLDTSCIRGMYVLYWLCYTCFKNVKLPTYVSQFLFQYLACNMFTDLTFSTNTEPDAFIFKFTCWHIVMLALYYIYMLCKCAYLTMLICDSPFLKL